MTEGEGNKETGGKCEEVNSKRKVLGRDRWSVRLLPNSPSP